MTAYLAAILALTILYALALASFHPWDLAFGLGLSSVLVFTSRRFLFGSSRILALDMLTLILVALLVLYADWQRAPYYLDAAIALSLLAFLATLVLARYHGEGEVF